MQNNLAQLRYQLNMSLSELAHLSGISKGHLWKIEQGYRVPTVPVAYAICKALGKSIMEVFPDG